MRPAYSYSAGPELLRLRAAIADCNGGAEEEEEEEQLCGWLPSRRSTATGQAAPLAQPAAPRAGQGRTRRVSVRWKPGHVLPRRISRPGPLRALRGPRSRQILRAPQHSAPVDGLDPGLDRGPLCVALEQGRGPPRSRPRTSRRLPSLSAPAPASLRVVEPQLPGLQRALHCSRLRAEGERGPGWRKLVAESGRGVQGPKGGGVGNHIRHCCPHFPVVIVTLCRKESRNCSLGTLLVGT